MTAETEAPKIQAVMTMGNAETHQYLTQWHMGDRKGLDALLDHHLPWIHDHVRKRMGPLLRGKGETCDYVQDAVVEFLRYGPRFTMTNAALFRALMVKIVENSLRHRHAWFTARRRDIARENPLPSDTILYLDSPKGAKHTPSQSAARHEQEAWIRLGMEFLNPEYREVLVLRKWDNLSFPEIGERLGISATAARLKHNRALSRLGSVVCSIRSGELSQVVKEEHPEG